MATEKALTIFAWEGKDQLGKVAKGELTAKNLNAAKMELRKKGIVSPKVKKKPATKGGKKITPGDIAVMARMLATMMSAGVPLVQSFDIIAQGQENPNMASLLFTIKADIEGGLSLTEALAAHPLYFDDLFVNLVEAGEKSGALEALLDKIATYKEKTEALKAKIKKAMTYPAAVLGIAVIVSGVLLYFVVPQFKDLFSGFGADLPAFTMMVIGLSEWLQEYWWIVLLSAGGAVTGFSYVFKRSPEFRKSLDRLILKLPIVGIILEKACIARFARTLETMFAAGVPLVEGLESVSGATGNIIYQEAVLGMMDEVATGQSLQYSMERAELFPNMPVQMIAIGEQSGRLDEMAGKVADFYEAEVDDAVDNLSALLEPMIMAILGILVGGLVVAMYLPIFKLGAVV